MATSPDLDPFPIPFDPYQRYAFAAALLPPWTGEEEPLLLEVCAGTLGRLGRFAPGARVVRLDDAGDPGPEDPPPYAAGAAVVGDASRPLFRPGAFEVVVALDVLERVAPERRRAILHQWMRVARRGIVLSAPFDSPEVVAAETELRAFDRQIHGEDHRPLFERRRGVLPALDETVRVITDAGWHARVLGHGNLGIWKRMARAHIAASTPDLLDLRAAADALYNGRIFERDGEPPFYRHFVLAAPTVAALDAFTPIPDTAVGPDPDDLARLDDAIERIHGGAERLRERSWTPPAAGPPPETRLDQLEAMIESHERSLARLRLLAREAGARGEIADQAMEALERALDEQAGAMASLETALAAAERAARQAAEEAAGEIGAELRRGLGTGARRIEAVEDGLGRRERAEEEIARRLHEIGRRLDVLEERVEREAAPPPVRRFARRRRPGEWLRRWIGSRRHVLEAIPANDIRLEGGELVATGHDPQLILESSRGRPPRGWAVVRIPVHATEGRLEPLLYVDTGAGFTEANRPALTPCRRGESVTVVHLPDEVRGLRLDPLPCPGRLALGRITIRELGLLPLGAFFLGDILRSHRGDAAGLGRLLLEGARVLAREGWEEWKQWLIHRGRAARRRAMPPYERWVEEEDELSNADRMKIRQHIRRMEGRPGIGVVIDGHGAPPAAWRRTIRSLRAQLWPDWEVTPARGPAPWGRLARTLGDDRLRSEGPPGGDLLLRLRAGDELAEHALYCVAAEIDADPELDILYADEDRVDARGRRRDPVFRTAPQPDRPVSSMETGRVVAWRRGLDAGELTDADLVERLLRGTPTGRVRHIPEVLLHVHEGRAAPLAAAPGRRGARTPARRARPWRLERLAVDGAVGGAIAPYDAWLRVNAWSRRRETLLRRRLDALAAPPRISVVMPVFEPDTELLDRAIRSVVEQVHEAWELCIADDGSRRPEVRETIEAWCGRDDRIRCVFREENGGIAAASNSAAEMATGELLAFLDQDDELTPDALGEVALHLAGRPEVDLLYTDEDKIDREGDRYDPACKPGPSPELLLSYMYAGHLLVIRRSLFREIGGFRAGLDGSQDHDLALRAWEAAREVSHLPRVLYHWRAVPGSTATTGRAKPHAFAAGARAVQDALERRGVAAETHRPGWAEEAGVGVYAHRFPDRGPKVTILIPTRDSPDVLRRCLESLERTTYRDREVVVVDDGSEDEATLRYLDGLPHRVLRIPRDDGGWSFARLNNRAVEEVDGELVLFLNDDTEVRTPEWLSQMVGYLGLAGVGAVGARLLFPGGTVQHAGVVQGLHRGAVGHAFKGLAATDPGYLSHAWITRNATAATAACLLTRRDVFRKLGGFDEEAFAVAYNDVDYGLRLRETGLRVVVAAGAELLHHEGQSRGGRDRPAELAAYRRRWGGRPDPYLNPNLSLRDESFPIRPRALAPDGLPPLRLLAVTHSLERAGAPLDQLEIVTELARRGRVRPVVYCPGDGPLREAYESAGIPVRVMQHPLGRIDRHRTYADAMRAFGERMRGWETDVLFSNTILGFYAVDAARLAGVPSIWKIHESEPWDTHVRFLGGDLAERARDALAHPYRVVFPSDATREVYAPYETRHNFETIPNGLDERPIRRDRLALDREAERRRLGVRDGEVVLLLLGTVCERKGQLDLVEAFAALPRSVARRVRVLIVGDRPGPYSRRVREATRGLPRRLAERVTVVAETPEVGPYLVAADVLVGTSRHEAYPRVIQEGMAHGLPIITTPVFGIREQVQEGTNALFYPPGDVDALAERIERLVDDPALRTRLGRASPDVLATLTGFDECIARYDELLREAALTGDGPLAGDRDAPAARPVGRPAPVERPAPAGPVPRPAGPPSPGAPAAPA